MPLSKCTCTRCNGSGKYSFHLTRGTVCFQCGGSGWQMVDLKKRAAKLAAAAIRDQEKQVHHAAMREAYYALVAEMNALFDNRFDTSTQLGVDQLDRVVFGKFGKRIHVLRDERFGAQKAL